MMAYSVHSLIQQNIVWGLEVVPECKWLHHIPNEGKMSKRRGHILNKEGRKKGVFDLFLPVARGEYHGLYVEVKLPGKKKDGGWKDDLTDEQREFKDDMEAAGYKCVVVRSVKEGLDAVLEYLKG
jgi:hypothetical protein